MSAIAFRFQTDIDAAAARLLQSYFTTVTADPQSSVRMDKQVAFTIEPVQAALPGDDHLFDPDFLSTDLYFVCLGNADSPATAGTVSLAVAATTTGLTGLAFNVPAATLQTPLSAAFVANAYPGCTVALLSPGVYRIVGSTNGAIPSGTLTADTTYLDPTCDWFVQEKQLGSAGSPYILLLILRQRPLVYSAPTTLLPATGVTVNTIQTGTGSVDQIQQVDFTIENTYAGIFSVSLTTPGILSGSIVSGSGFSGPLVVNPIIKTKGNHGLTTGDAVNITSASEDVVGSSIVGTFTVTVLSPTTFQITLAQAVLSATLQLTTPHNITQVCGVASPQMTADNFANLLAVHPAVIYQSGGSSNNIIVSKVGTSYRVHFTGSLGNSSVPTLAVTNINLVAAKGLSGILNFNTIELYEYSLTQTASSFGLPITIQRVRASGENRTVFGPVSVTIFKDNLDLTSAVNVSIPTCVIVNPSTFALVSPTATQFCTSNNIARVDGSGNLLCGTRLRFIPTGTGGSVQTSPDGITWTTQQTWP